MASISQAISHFPNLQQLAQPASFTTNTNQLQFRSQTQTNTDFSFVTAEGDRVTLSSGTREDTSFDTYSFQGFAKGQAVSFQGQQFRTSIQENFNLLVEGDLNEQEQADIQEFLTSAKTILQELREGNTEEATLAAASLGNLETLSQAALFVRHSTSVAVATQSSRAAVLGSPDSRETPGGRLTSGPEQNGGLSHLLERIREAQERFQIDPEDLLDRLPRLATRIVDSLKRDSESEDSPPSILQQIQKEFLESILESTRDSKDVQESQDSQVDDSKQAAFVDPSSDNQLGSNHITPELELINGDSRTAQVENPKAV